MTEFPWLQKRKNYREIPPSDLKKHSCNAHFFIFFLHTSLFIRFHLLRSCQWMLMFQCSLNFLLYIPHRYLFINQSSQWTYTAVVMHSYKVKLDKNRQIVIAIPYISFSFSNFLNFLYCICSFCLFFLKISISPPNRM